MRRGLGLPDGVLSIVGEPRWAPQQFWSANSKIRLTTKHTENKRKSLAQIQVIRCSWRPASSSTRTKCGCAYIRQTRRDRKSTRLNSSHTVISYAVFCLKKKKK